MSSTESDGGRDEAAGRPAAATAATPRTAFTELMAPKAKPAAPVAAPSFSGRDGLGAYIANPASFPASLIVFYDEAFVAIHDRYPKASVHCLLLPRSAAHTRQHPFDAFDDADFLASVRTAAARLEQAVASELRRRFGAFSRADEARQAVLTGTVDDGGAELPAGRDWQADVRVGVHAHPSMSHLHVHVLSRDMHSANARHRKHYNSFTTPFFVPLADFPLAADDPRRKSPGGSGRGHLRNDLVCWRCGRNFGNGYKALSEHLGDEFEQWKRE